MLYPASLLHIPALFVVGFTENVIASSAEGTLIISDGDGEMESVGFHIRNMNESNTLHPSVKTPFVSATVTYWIT